MKYKQKLKIVEAFHYVGNFNSLCAWFLENSIHSTLPFFWAGRELQSFEEGTIIPGSYIILSADKKTVSVMKEKEFEASYTIPKKGAKKKGEKKSEPK